MPSSQAVIPDINTLFLSVCLVLFTSLATIKSSSEVIKGWSFREAESSFGCKLNCGSTFVNWTVFVWKEGDGAGGLGGGTFLSLLTSVLSGLDWLGSKPNWVLKCSLKIYIYSHVYQSK